MTINIFKNITVNINDDNPFKNDWINYIKSISDLMNDIEIGCYCEINVLYSSNIHDESYRHIEDDIYIKNNYVYDKKIGIALKKSTYNSIDIIISNSSVEWIFWLIHMILLMNKSTLVHCAGVEKNNKAILFPSWGGVGKTAIVSKFVNNWGWNLLGDDFVVINSEGRCYGFPKPMVLYSYHKNLFPTIFQNNKGPMTPIILNDILANLTEPIKKLVRPFPKVLQYLRKYNPHSKRIRPETIFGVNKLSKKARIENIIWIERVNNSEEVIQESIPYSEMISKIVGSTINEFDDRCLKMTNIAFGNGVIDSYMLYSEMQNIVKDSIENTNTKIVYIPSSVSIEKVPEIIHSIK